MKLNIIQVGERCEKLRVAGCERRRKPLKPAFIKIDERGDNMPGRVEKIGEIAANTSAGARKAAKGRYAIDRVKYTGRKTHTGNKLYAVYGHLKRR